MGAVWRNQMKRLLLSLAISAAAITGPAVAQAPDNRYQDRPGSYRDDDGGRGNISSRIEQLRERIEEGVRSGAISRREALSLRSSLRSLTELERRYSRNGLTNGELQDLQLRLRSLRQEVRQADDGARGRYDDWDRQGGRDDDRYDDRDGRRDDGRGYDRDDSRYDDSDDRYPEREQRGGLGGVIDGVLGRTPATLQVGQRAPTDLYGVPYEYRGQYRDTDQSYYRSDGRQIYQIDARTRAVVRIHTMNR
ncbi:hypothetical protein [Sphingopyxis panaciterrae]